MSVLVFAAPYAPPSPPVPPTNTGLSLTWTGANGTAWDLNDPDGGVVLVGDVEGMHTPEWVDYTQEFDGIDGQEYFGGVAKARAVEWPLFVFSDTSSADWLDVERAWWGSFKPRGSVGTWTVSSPAGESRSLKCRLTSDGGYAHSFDPSKAAWALYQVSLIADDPWWYGTPITGVWTAPAPILFFGGGAVPGGTQLAPPFGITQSNTFDTATLYNPGDEPTFPTWTLNGPITSATITVAGGSLVIPAVASGSTMIVNTSPDNPTALLNGVDVSGTITTWDPRPLPPQASVSVSMTVTSGVGASISVSAPTKYWRAFG
jgi:hypothetical protein